MKLHCSSEVEVSPGRLFHLWNVYLNRNGKDLQMRWRLCVLDSVEANDLPSDDDNDDAILHTGDGGRLDKHFTLL